MYPLVEPPASKPWRYQRYEYRLIYKRPRANGSGHEDIETYRSDDRAMVDNQLAREQQYEEDFEGQGSFYIERREAGTWEQLPQTSTADTSL